MTNIKSLFSFEWWLTVGAALVILSFVQDLVRRSVYSLVKKTGSYLRITGSKSRDKLIEAGRALADSPVVFAITVREEARLRQRAIYLMLCGLLSANAAGFIAIAQANPVAMAALDWPFPHATLPHLGGYVMFSSIVSLIVASAEWSRSMKREVLIRVAEKFLAGREQAGLSPHSSDTSAN